MEKIRSKPTRLDQGHRPFNEAGDDKAGQSRSHLISIHAEPGARLVPGDLRRIEDVTRPHILERRGRYQVLFAILFAQ